MKHTFIRTCLPALAAWLVLQAPLSAQSSESQDTVVTSVRLEMVGQENENVFHFYEDVVVTGTNLKATCDEMTVLASRVGEQSSEGTVGELGAITHITLVGNVVIEQSGRRAEAGRAELFPREGKVVLTENPVVYDAEGTVKGERIELYKDEKKARVFGSADKDPNKRPTVTLPSMGDMGYKEGRN